MTSNLIILNGFSLCKRVGLNHVAVAIGEQHALQGGKRVTVTGCTTSGQVKTDEQGSLDASLLRLEWKRIAKTA